MRIAVLGAGFMGGTHARAYQKLPDVEIAAIYAQSGERAGPLCEELGTVWVDDLDRLLADQTLDAVDICLPTPQHGPALRAALAAGKHALVEKPLALSDDEAAALVDAAARSGRIVMVAHVLRFWPEYVALKQVLDSGELGKPVSGFAARRQPFPAWSRLFKRAEITGGAIIDQMIHDYDALNWIFGAPRTVLARGLHNPRSDGLDQTQVLIGYDGASALVDGGMMMPDSYPFTSRLEVLCERGAVEYHFRAGGRSFEIGEPTNELTVYRVEGDPKTLAVEQSDPFENEVAYFVDCVRDGKPATRATPADARRALQVALAARDSAESGQLVELTS